MSSMRRARLPVCGVWPSLSPSAAPPPVGTSGSPEAGAAFGASGARGVCGVVEAVTEATDGRDDFRTQLLADAGDEDLDRVRIAVEILIVDMLDQFGAADHLALVVHEVAQQLVFLRRQLDRLALERDAARTRVEPHVAGGQFAGGIARGAADQRAQTGDQFFRLERLDEIVVRPGVEPGDLVGPAIARG